jgi:hypothetical protein
MICPITYGYTVPCKSTGGIQSVYIGQYNSGLTYTTDSSSPGATSSFNTITGFGGATSSFYKFEAQLETASLVEAGAFSNENGTAFYTQTAMIVLQGLNQPLVEQINILGKGRWRIIFLDQNGLYWLMGKQNPVNVSASTPGLGKAYGDLNGAIITFEGKEPAPITQVSSAALIALGITN